MRANVLTDARLLKHAGRFAWLDIDTEKPVNFAFVEQFPIEAWPTIYVLDPVAEKVLLRWMGTATAPELEKLLGEAERTFRKERTDAAGEAMARGAALAAARNHADAARAFSDALAAGGPRWSERARAADAMMQALSMADGSQACAGAAAELLPKLEQGSAYARVAATGLSCAASIEEPGSRGPAIRAVEPYARMALGLKGVLAEDHSGLFAAVHEAREAQGDTAGAKRVAREWLAWIEDAARQVKDPLARSAFDGARLTAAMALGDPRRALPALRASARALPGEYFAQSYQASCALEAGEPQEALEAARRAVRLAEGPRKVRVMTIEAQAQKALGEEAEARSVLEAAIAHGEGLPEASRPKGHLRRARKLLEQWAPKVEAPAADPAAADPRPLAPTPVPEPAPAPR